MDFFHSRGENVYYFISESNVRNQVLVWKPWVCSFKARCQHRVKGHLIVIFWTETWWTRKIKTSRNKRNSVCVGIFHEKEVPHKEWYCTPTKLMINWLVNRTYARHGCSTLLLSASCPLLRLTGCQLLYNEVCISGCRLVLMKSQIAVTSRNFQSPFFKRLLPYPLWGGSCLAIQKWTDLC